MPSRIRLVVASSVLPLFVMASFAAADRFEIDGNSTVALTLNASVPVSGTLIGDYDAKTNPTGSMTRPGLFGGSGNQPVDFDANVTVSGDTGPTTTTGSIDLDLSQIDSSLLTVEAMNLELDAATVSGIDSEFSLIYETFRSYDPFSLYIGGLPISFPIGETQFIRSEISLVEPFTIFAVDDGSDIVFNTVVPVIWTLEFDPGTGPQVQEIPIGIPFIGAITESKGVRRIEFGGQSAQTETQDPGLEIGPLPLEIPTFPPGDETVGVLLAGAIGVSSFDFDFVVSLMGTESVPELPEDLTGDGLVNSADLGLLIAEWGFCEDCAADFDGDGLVDASDLGAIIAAWSF